LGLAQQHTTLGFWDFTRMVTSVILLMIICMTTGMQARDPAIPQRAEVNGVNRLSVALASTTLRLRVNNVMVVEVTSLNMTSATKPMLVGFVSSLMIYRLSSLAGNLIRQSTQRLSSLPKRSIR
jgi:hypothetical protein